MTIIYGLPVVKMYLHLLLKTFLFQNLETEIEMNTIKVSRCFPEEETSPSRGSSWFQECIRISNKLPGKLTLKLKKKRK